MMAEKKARVNSILTLAAAALTGMVAGQQPFLDCSAAFANILDD